MKKLLYVSILALAFACGDGSKRDSKAGTDAQENTNTEETVSPDTTDIMNETDTTSVDGNL